MGAKVGMPLLKLDRKIHIPKPKTRHGNAAAVIYEGLEERRSSDPDLDRTKTCNNMYYGYKSAESLNNYWELMANDYRVVDKNGVEKKLKSNAVIAFAGICKPNEEYMQTLTEEEQIRFLQDSAIIIKAMYEKRGMVIDSIVMHLDERVPHLHYYGHDPQYRLGRKIGIPLFTALNSGEYPPKMRALGWDVEDLKDYDVEATKTMSEEELKEYKKNFKEKRKEKHGKSSKVYKAEKQAAKIKEEVANMKAEFENECEFKKFSMETMERVTKRDLEYEKQKLEEEKQKFQKEQEEEKAKMEEWTNLLAMQEMELKDHEKDLNVRENEYKAHVDDLNEREKNYKATVENSVKMDYTQRENQLNEEYNKRKEELENEYKQKQDKYKKRKQQLNNAIKAHNELLKLGKEKEKELKEKDQANDRKSKLEQVQKTFAYDLERWKRKQMQDDKEYE